MTPMEKRLAKCYPSEAGKPYRPSNGTEGDMFEGQFCNRCHRDQDENDPCEIRLLTHGLRTDEAGYPTEWIYDRNGRPTCTAFNDVLDAEQEPSSRCPNTGDLFA